MIRSNLGTISILYYASRAINANYFGNNYPLVIQRLLISY